MCLSSMPVRLKDESAGTGLEGGSPRPRRAQVVEAVVLVRTRLAHWALRIGLPANVFGSASVLLWGQDVEAAERDRDLRRLWTAGVK